MEDIGELLGIVILFFYGLTVLNFFIKFGLKHFRPQLMKHPKFFKFYMKVVKFFVTWHKWFGFATILAIGGHFYIQFTNEGLSISGVIAASAMLAQVLLGVYGKYFHPKNKVWFWIHRIIAIIIAVAIFVHLGSGD